MSGGQGRRRERGPFDSVDQARSEYDYDPLLGLVTRRRDGKVLGSGDRHGGRKTVNIGGRRYTLTHLIWYLKTGHWPRPVDEVDHRRHDHRDDRWGEIRLATRSRNCLNRRKHRNGSASKYQGLKLLSDGRWRVRVCGLDGRTYNVGTFPADAEVAAARARDLAAVRLCGETVTLNFPELAVDKRHVQANKRRAALVARWHTWPTRSRQSVGEHTFQVLRIYVEIFGTPRPDVVTHILYHDLGEVGTGDAPYPVKSDNPVLKAEMERLEDRVLLTMGIVLPDLSGEERIRFKFCDLLECAEFAIDETLLGNRFMEPVADQVKGLRGYLDAMSPSDRNHAVHYCGSAGVSLDRDHLHSINPLLRNAYDELYKEATRGR